jgi:hypothetical protein
MLAVIRDFLRERCQRQRRCVGSGTHRKCFSQEGIYQQDRAAPSTSQRGQSPTAGAGSIIGRLWCWRAYCPSVHARSPDGRRRADHGDAQGRWFWNRRAPADQSFLINCSAANWASASDAKSSGVTTLLRRPWEARTRTGGATARRGDYLPSQVSRGLRCSLVQFAS